MVKRIAKLMGALGWAALSTGAIGTAHAGIRNQAANLYTSTKLWSPVDYSNEWILYIDPYSVFKVNINEWDANITFVDSNNNYDLSKTFTYRINCSNLTFRQQGWRVNGVLKEWTSPLGNFGGMGLEGQKTSITPGSIMWTAKEYLCGTSISGKKYYWSYSLFRDNNIRGSIDQFWFMDNTVTISDYDINLRHVSLMTSSIRNDDRKFSDLFVKCDKHEMLEASDGVTTTDWFPVPSGSGVEVLFDKMCSGRFNFVSFQTSSITMPSPKNAQAPMPNGETGNQMKTGAGMDEAKRKCADLGFRSGTPKFGQCVLKLTD